MSKTITSLHNPRVKHAVTLRERRGRERTGCTIIDGAREIQRAMQGGVRLVELFICRELCRTDDSTAVVRAAEQAGAVLIDVTPGIYQKIAFGDRSEGVVAVAKTPHRTLADLSLSEMPLVAVLDGVEKPGNVGAIIRSADGAGVEGIIVSDGGTDLFNPNAIRASLGLIFSLPIVSASSDEARSWLNAKGLHLVTARVDGQRDYCDADFTKPAAIILGSEAHGLNDTWRSDGVASVKLPMRGHGDSLNVSVTAAVLFYEAQRQRSASRSRGGLPQPG